MVWPYAISEGDARVAKKPSPEPPKEALPDGEPNRYLAKFKASLCKRWSVTRRETLYEIFDLAAFLWALDRPDEALAVAGSVAAEVPTPPPLPRGGVNYNIWCPATYSHALVARLGARTVPDRATASRTAILSDTGIARDNPSYLADCVTSAREVAAAVPNPKAMKWECLALTRALGDMVLYAELASAGDQLFARHSAAAGTLLARLVPKLQAKLLTA